MAVPKKKVSRSRRDKRRYSGSNQMNQVEVKSCPQCGEMVRPHRVCNHCFHYDGRQVVEAVAPETQAE
jgi:large subunit ribosomal protein L32